MHKNASKLLRPKHKKVTQLLRLDRWHYLIGSYQGASMVLILKVLLKIVLGNN